MRQVMRSSIFWILIVLIAMIVTFSLITPSGTFLTTFNIQSILSDSSVLLVMGTAAALVIIGGGIDLSLGSIVTFAAVAGMLAMQHVGVQHGWGAVAVGCVAAIAGGLAWGAINGVLSAYAKIPPFVVTLGSFGAALGAARLLSGGTAPAGGPTVFQETIGLSTVLGLPVTFLIAAAIVVVFGCVLAFTRFGEHVYLVGSNEEAARRGGIHAARVQVAIYTLAGLLGALAGLLDTARFDTASINTGHTLELIGAIAAVIIGGASLTGGVGTIAGMVIGVFIPTVLNNGLIITGIQRFWQDIMVGVILVAAVWFDQWRRGRETAMAAAPVRSG